MGLWPCRGRGLEMQNYLVRLGEERIHLGGEESTLGSLQELMVKATSQDKAIQKAAEKYMKDYRISPLVVRVLMISLPPTFMEFGKKAYKERKE